MNNYKWLNEQQTMVLCKDTNQALDEGGPFWDDYLQYVADGSVTDPWKTFEELKLLKSADTKAECQSYIHSVYPAAIQASASLGIYPAEVVTTMKDFIAACIEEENRVHDLVTAATTEADLNAITVVWPVL